MENKNKKILYWSAGLIVAYILFVKLKSVGTKQIVPNVEGGVTQGLNFKAMADSIYEAMDGYGTSFQIIINEFVKLNNNYDFDALYKAYGTRTVSSGAGNVFVSDYTGDLLGALKDELDANEISKINTLLTNKNIKTI
jgi:hypothetical protein